jgi:hypothetical protein
MANPSVEKLKQFGLRHGEKAGVGLLAALCLFFLAKGFTHPTIDMTPDQLKKAAAAADQNLGRPQKDEDILSRLESENIKEVGFEKTVDKRIAVKQDAALFAFDNSWVSPEPGAGLLRDMPILLAVNTLYAHSGRGGLIVFERDENGDLVEDKHVGEPVQKKRKKRPPGMRSPTGKRRKKKTSSVEIAAKEKKKNESENAKLKAKLVGEAKDEPAKDDEDDFDSKDWKETTKGYRWVALTGVFDHKQQRENYAKALKIDFASAAPHYLRLDAERQSLNSDGSWSEWEEVDREPSKDVLDDAVEEDEELVPSEAIIKSIADYLPFLRSSYHRGVYVAELVPAEKRKIEMPKTGAGGMGMPGGSGGSSSSSGMLGGMPGSMGGGSSSKGAGGMPGRGFGGMSGGSMPGSGGMPGGSMASGMGGMGGMGGAPSGGGPEDTEFEKTEAAKIMARMLDFTVQPDTTYRYRVRIVVRNPNLGWEMVSATTDTKEEEVPGPWSEPSTAVQVPADIAAYASQPAELPNDPRNVVKFQLARFNPEDGVTVVKNFDAAPGQVVGGSSSATIPKYTGEKVQSQVKPIDFTSHQIVIGTVGKRESLAVLNLSGAPIDDPARALVMRQDGRLVLRDQARDVADSQMSEMKSIYDEILESIVHKPKKRRSSMMGGGGSSSGGMMGSGGMPGGMGGMPR